MFENKALLSRDSTWDWKTKVAIVSGGSMCICSVKCVFFASNSSRVAVNYLGEADNNYPDLIKEVLETIIVDGGMSINMQ